MGRGDPLSAVVVLSSSRSRFECLEQDPYPAENEILFLTISFKVLLVLSELYLLKNKGFNQQFLS